MRPTGFGLTTAAMATSRKVGCVLLVKEFGSKMVVKGICLVSAEWASVLALVLVLALVSVVRRGLVDGLRSDGRVVVAVCRCSWTVAAVVCRQIGEAVDGCAGVDRHVRAREAGCCGYWQALRSEAGLE